MRVWQRGLLFGLVVCWAVGLAWAYWWFDGRYGKTFERPAYFSGEAVRAPLPAGQVQVLHVWQAGCPCNAGHEAYINEMTERFSAQGVQFLRAGSVEARNGVLAGLSQWQLPRAWSDWPGGPSVAIWDAQGNLAYVGPYSDGASCNSDSSFVEPVIRALLEGRSVNITRQDTVSCLCDLDDGAFAP